MFKCSVYRQEIINRFEIGLSASSRDFITYKKLAPYNLTYDTVDKRYFQTAEFKPLFEHDAKRNLTKLANDMSDGFDAIGDIHFPVEAPSSLNVPDIFIVARLVQTMLNKKAVSIIYTSLSSGAGARELIPYAIVDNDLRWHVLAFDRKSLSFRDFVLTRISEVTIIDTPNEEESAQADLEWQHLIPLPLVPHPNNVEHPAALEMDYGMENKQLLINVRSAMTGYLLRR